MAQLAGEISTSSGIPSSVITSSRSTIEFTLSESTLYALTQSIFCVGLGNGILSNAFTKTLIESKFRASEFKDCLLPLARFFGANVKQDATKIYINKKDLIGLTPLANNSAESIFVALLLTVMTYEADDYISRFSIRKWKTEFIVSQGKNVCRNILVVDIRGTATYASTANPNLDRQVTNADVTITPNNII